ncbi:MAG: mercury methylation ferredoxin HgcB [Thermodesulfobacteriota bacterium]
MKDFRYLEDKATLALDRDACVGCGACAAVCPHGVPVIEDGKARLADPGACMECGACAMNCPASAITVTPGVGCASYIVQAWLHRAGIRRKTPACC